MVYSTYPTRKQLAMLAQLHIPAERVKLLCRSAARSIIRTELSNYLEARRAKEQESVERQKAIAAKLDELEQRWTDNHE